MPGTNLGYGGATSNEVCTVKPWVRQLKRTQLSQLAAISMNIFQNYKTINRVATSIRRRKLFESPARFQQITNISLNISETFNGNLEGNNDHGYKKVGLYMIRES